MEALDETTVNVVTFEVAKDSGVHMSVTSPTSVNETGLKLNGVSKSAALDSGEDQNVVISVPVTSLSSVVTVEQANSEPMEVVNDNLLSNDNETLTSNDVSKEKLHISPENEVLITTEEEHIVIETEVVTDNMNTSSENVLFETEVLVEKDEVSTANLNNENDSNCFESDKLLSNLEGQDIELSEALRSSDITEGSDNNNSVGRQEVLNNEELLDILEGNDTDQPFYDVTSSEEAKRAVQQFNKLKNKRYTSSPTPQNIKVVKIKPKEKSLKPIKDLKPFGLVKEESIVKSLVQDWDDDEHDDNKLKKEILADSELLLNESEQMVSQQEDLSKSVDESLGNVSDSGEQSQNSTKTSDNQIQRRRVIKKKVIFDPDNPDTFTKGKIIVKPKEQTKIQVDKEIQITKKIKPEPVPQASPKSPVPKSPWKKPIAKANKQNKRLTEVDRLLMDEGAVNMIYQLTPEAGKGKKNIRNKAELIKKINQSSTPDAKEMKFRERKKESYKCEDAEPKKIIALKQRASLSGSIKSAGEDFETHSADDSIIYRRHSSSSYSSSCMSPRRLSDVEYTLQAAQAQAAAASASESAIKEENGVEENVFTINSSNKTEIINKKDCLSLKQKLNSKLSNALNKRKREVKPEKPIKQRKIKPKVSRDFTILKEYQTLSITVEDNIAEITVKAAKLCSIEMLTELEEVLKYADAQSHILVILIRSEKERILPTLDLNVFLDGSAEKKINYAFDVTEAIRNLLLRLQSHSKILICGISGPCEELELALMSLCDMVIASERATFAFSPVKNAPIVPGISVLRARCQDNLVNELVLFGRQIQASEALQRGLINRTLWHDRFYDELHALVKDIASQQSNNLMVKKKILNMSKHQMVATFQSNLSSEQDLVAAYWTSVEGQESIRAYLNRD